MSSLSTNFENLENKLLDIPNNLVNYMKANNIANSIVLLILLYVILASPMLNPSLLSIFNNMFFKILYVFLVMCLVSRNPVLSLIVAVVLVVVLNNLIPDNNKVEPTKPENRAHVIEAGSVIATTSSGQTIVLPPSVVPPSVVSPSVVPDTLPKNVVHPKSEESKIEKFDDVVQQEQVPVQVHNDERLTQRQQMKKLWTSMNNKPNVLSDIGANKCDSVHVNSACDVLGTNSMEYNNARVAGSNEPCPVDGETVGFYENVDKEYAEY